MPCLYHVVDEEDLAFQLQACQNRDPVICSLRDKQKNHSSPLFEMKDGVIYRKGKDDQLLLYVPIGTGE